MAEIQTMFLKFAVRPQYYLTPAGDPALENSNTKCWNLATVPIYFMFFNNIIFLYIFLKIYTCLHFNVGRKRMHLEAL